MCPALAEHDVCFASDVHFVRDVRLRHVKTESNSALFPLCLPEHVPEEIDDGVHEFDQPAETGIFMDLAAVFAALFDLAAADVASLVAVGVFVGDRRDIDFRFP